MVCGADAGRSGERDIGELSGESIKGHGFWKVVTARQVSNIEWVEGRWGVGFCKAKRRFLEGEEVTNIDWVGSQKMSGCATWRVLVSLLPMRLGGDGLEWLRTTRWDEPWLSADDWADGVGRDLVVITIVSILCLNETIPLSLLQ